MGLCTIMHKVLFVSVMVFISNGLSSNGIGLNDTARPKVVKIGALLNFNTIVGKVAKVAIEAAVEDVNNNNTILGETKLQVAMHDTKNSSFLGMLDALGLMDGETVAIIGPQTSATAHVVSQIADEIQIPMLSFGATDPTLSSLQYPFFVRTTQNDLFQMAAIAEIIYYYGWRDVTAIYVDDDHGRNGIAALGDKLAERRCRISHKAPISPRLSRENIHNELKTANLEESRIFVLLAYADWGLEVFRVAQDNEMTGSGYVWLVTDWLASTFDTNSFISPEDIGGVQGAITLRMHTPDSQQKTKFVSGWKTLTRDKMVNGTGLNSYGLYAYDTVWLLAYGIDAFFKQGENISFSQDPNGTEQHRGKLQVDEVRIFNEGDRLLRSILQVNTTGVAGPIKFDSDRNLIHPAYEVMNVNGTGFKRIGYWSNYSGLSVVPPETLYTKPPNRSSLSQELDSVIWPGQTKQKPRGWVFPENGRQLRIAVPNNVIYQELVSVKGADSFSGFCIDVFRAALESLPYAVPHKLHVFGDGHNKPKISELLQLIEAGVYDAAVGDLAITNNRTRIVDFTQPYVESGLVVVAPVQKSNSNSLAFLRPFTPMMWLVTGIFFLVVGVVVWILEHRVNDDFRGPPKRQIATIIWFSFSTLFFSHKQNTVSSLGRFVLLIWLFVVLILNSSYTASLTSILTVEQLSSPIKGIESLVTGNDRIGFQRGSFAENYLAEEYNIARSRLVALNTVEDYAKALKDGPQKEGGVAAVIDERAYIELFLSSRCDFSIVGQEFSKNGWGFAFPRDSPLAVDMSAAILKLSEGGELQRIHDKWLQSSACSSEGAKESINRLHLKSFWGLFLMCGVACLLALLLYLIKILWTFSNYSEDTEPSSRGTSSPGLQTFISFVSEKEADITSRSKKRRMERASNKVGGGDESPNCSFGNSNKV
ncbi:PREDICTED: glutamate receptor 3.6-like [Populus euphratica]|uniref:Glutamate receptor n=1 Tax=Populus euphratica TaxID=75702 RepID=A0AAJ6U3C0_POPEU|nr:PREDICTED: glutamate receptor 3.6-like [Populus euphratica]